MHQVHNPKLTKSQKRSLWDEILNDFDKSELGPTAYCRKHQIRYDNFNYYQRAHQRMQLTKFIPVTPPTLTTAVTSTPQQIKIVTDKFTIHLPTDLEPGQLANIIKGVAAGC